jgi:hypothetical protein
MERKNLEITSSLGRIHQSLQGEKEYGNPGRVVYSSGVGATFVCVSIKAHTAHNRYCFFLGSPFFFVALSLELWHHRRIYNEERETCVCTGRSSSSRSSSQFLFLPVYSFFYLFIFRVYLNFLLFFLTRRRGDSPCKRLFTWHPNLFFFSFLPPFFGSSLEQTKHEKATQRESKTCARVIRFIRFGDPGRPLPPPRNQGLIHTQIQKKMERVGRISVRVFTTWWCVCVAGHRTKGGGGSRHPVETL